MLSRKKKEQKAFSIIPFVSPMGTSLFSVDVEGSDLEILRSNSREISWPRLNCAEKWNSTRFGSLKLEIEDFLLAPNYKKVADVTASKIHVEKRYLDSKQVAFAS